METVASDALAFELFFEAERRSLFRALYLMTGSRSAEASLSRRSG